jgi:hypothetical protein
LKRSALNKRMRRRLYAGFWPAVALVALLVAVQAATLIHESDIAAHAPGDTCEFCLHATPLGHGTVDLGPVAQFPAPAPVYDVPLALTAPRRVLISPVPRGPPFSLTS